MKKAVTILLAVIMIFSLSLSVLAIEYEGGDKYGETIINATVPQMVSYTINIPATRTFEFNDITTKELGTITVSNVSEEIPDGWFIQVVVGASDLGYKFINELQEEAVNYGRGIPVTYTFQEDGEDPSEGTEMEGGVWQNYTAVLYTADSEVTDGSNYSGLAITATVAQDDWDAAEPGDYEATINFNFHLWDPATYNGN